VALVYNWHLRRKMQYPYAEHHPERQVGFVFDINRCIGCQTCTMACRSTWTFSDGQEYMWWNNVETKPYGGYPQHWDIKLMKRHGPQGWRGSTYAGKTIFEKPDGHLRDEPLGFEPEQPEWRFPNIYEDTPPAASDKPMALPVHQKFFFYLQRICNHCTYPGCLAACPRKAVYKRPEDGVVLIDQDRCLGYQECVSGCPYKKSLFNTVSKTSEKCIACYPRLEKGEIPRCVAACVGHIRLAGWISPPERARENNTIDYLVHVRKVALPLYPQFGTEPNVYYIPPRWAPRPYLLQTFGPGAEEAIRTRMNPDAELVGVLKLFGATTGLIERYSLNTRTIVGYGADGKTVVEMALEEPFYERPYYDGTYGVHRFNEP